MIYGGCQGKPQIAIMEKTCPQCGNEIEIMSVDTQARCENCGTVIFNDALSCVQWCKYARRCVGDEMYGQLMELARQTEERRAAERAAGKAAKAS